MRRFAASSSNQTFFIWPTLLLGAEAVRRGSRPLLDTRFLPLLAWGYLQYRLCGDYRTRLGGGGPGSAKPPKWLVTSGPYALSRNPMYLGHLIFMAGLILSLRSPLGWLVLLERWHHFSSRVTEDEERLQRLFGAEYQSYRSEVPRWLPGLR